MPLASGTRIGPYEIQSLLGIGGMGEVHRATDTKLKRQVAIKILPAELSDDPGRRARFQREAELLAALNHPRIAAIYGCEDAGPQLALVMELVEGRTLDQVMADRGRGLPVEEALLIARQIAEGLEAAHARGIVHRDLKPANIKLRPDDSVKVLDFGLAKADALRAPGAIDRGQIESPTVTSHALTLQGVILGTAAYMSPEQARGMAVDKRTDIWAFGVVLFEMLAGSRLFEADHLSETVAAVLTKEPDWSRLPAATPAAIRTLLRRCLQKDRTKRLADIADARLEIEDALDEPSASQLPGPVAEIRRPPAWRRVLPWAVALVPAIAAVALWAPWRAPANGASVRITADLGSDVVLNPGRGGAFALSPDGLTLVFAARLPTAPRGVAPGQLYVRRLTDLHAEPLAGTGGAQFPFFSPDGQWIGFFAGGSLKKISVAGGAVITLCKAQRPWGGWWTSDEEILFSSLAPDDAAGGVVLRVGSAGGEPQRATTAAPGDHSHLWPQALPSGAGILYTATKSSDAYDDALIMTQPPAGGQPKVVHAGGYHARYLPSGHLAFVRDGTLFLVPFSLRSLAVTGPPVPMIDKLALAPAGGSALYSVSDAGTLVYMPSAAANAVGRGPILWMNRAGDTRTLRAEPSAWGKPSFSPDGRRLALTMSDGRQHDIWIYDWERDTLTRLTNDPANDMTPVWTPDGKRIVFASNRARPAGPANLYWQRADQTGEVQRLTDSPVPQLPGSWHPNGRVLAFHEGDPRAGSQRLMLLTIAGDEKAGWTVSEPTEFLGGPFLKSFPTFSPDGKWIAYALMQGMPQIYVQPFPGPGSRLQVSSESAVVPLWSRTRPELYFSSAADEIQQMWVVRYKTEGDRFNADRPQLLFTERFSANAPVNAFGPGFDLHPDGERFAVAPAIRPADSSTESRLVFVFNAFDEARRLAGR
jgi:Tol biopolymer transport system component